jgi:hypothetical protein
MVIDNLNIVRSVAPSEYDSPLMVDTDRLIAGQSSFQRLQPVARGSHQVVKPDRRMKSLTAEPLDVRGVASLACSDIVVTGIGSLLWLKDVHAGIIISGNTIYGFDGDERGENSARFLHRATIAPERAT